MNGLYGMRQARARFRLELKAKTAAGSFRPWARKTYNPQGAVGKLAQIVGER